MKLRIVVETEVKPDETIGAKEQIAGALERFCNISVVKVEEIK